MAETLTRSALRASDGRLLDLDVRRWMAPADAVDELLLDRAHGPVLDVGCGPGRHVRALRARGVESLGVEIAPSAVALARRRGTPILEQSVFDPLPERGYWRTALLLDGSVGIGGDPAVLIGRLAGQMRADARVLLEAEHPDVPTETLDVRIETPTSAGPWFRWARLSHLDIAQLGRRTGFAVTEAWEDSGRYFAQLDRGHLQRGRLDAGRLDAGRWARRGRRQRRSSRM